MLVNIPTKPFFFFKYHLVDKKGKILARSQKQFLVYMMLSFRFCLLFSEVPNISDPNQEFIQMAKQVSYFIIFITNKIILQVIINFNLTYLVSDSILQSGQNSEYFQSWKLAVKSKSSCDNAVFSIKFMQKHFYKNNEAKQK